VQTAFFRHVIKADKPAQKWVRTDKFCQPEPDSAPVSLFRLPLQHTNFPL